MYLNYPSPPADLATLGFSIVHYSCLDGVVYLHQFRDRSMVAIRAEAVFNEDARELRAQLRAAGSELEHGDLSSLQAHLQRYVSDVRAERDVARSG